MPLVIYGVKLYREKVIEDCLDEASIAIELLRWLLELNWMVRVIKVTRFIKSKVKMEIVEASLVG